jgi:hypothetical protein
MTYKISQKTIIGHFARWAIELTPYVVPENLELACMLLTVGTFQICQHKNNQNERYYEGSQEYLTSHLKDMIPSIEQIAAWGTPKRPKITPEDLPRWDAPDFHYIDIYFLIGNMIRTIIQEAELENRDT